MPEKRYSIRNNRWEQAFLEGLSLLPEGGVETVQSLPDGKAVHFHTAFLPPVDSALPDSTWGRLSLHLSHDEDTAVCVYCLAVNEREQEIDGTYMRLDRFLSGSAASREKKLRVLMELGAVRAVNEEDVLLYSLTGRYFFLALDIMGDGKAKASGFRIYAEGDLFLRTFPEIYRERGGFFHRYLSVFSSIYSDFQDEIDSLPQLLNIETCPKELLPVYGEWLGIDLSGGFLPEEVCRQLVREGYELNRKKGTKWVMRRIVEIVLGCDAEILEHNTMRGYLLNDGAEIPSNLKEGGIYDVTILIHGRIRETLRHQLLFLLEQFKPIRAKLRLVELTGNSVADGNAWLDLNAALPSEKEPTLDSEVNMGDLLTLE